MAIYEAFNSNGVSVVVSDVDLDQAARDDGPLSTELADAAAQARRTDLVEHLRRSLDGDDRARKLAAAKALLALDDRSAGGCSNRLPHRSPTRSSPRASLQSRRGCADRRPHWICFDNPETDPQLARLLVSNYNSHLRLEAGDIRFLITALRHYLARSLPWLTKLRSDIWDNGVFLIVNALSNDGAVRLLRDIAPERSDAAAAAGGATRAHERRRHRDRGKRPAGALA